MFSLTSGVSAEVRAAALPKVDNIGGLVEEYIYDEANNSSKRNVYQNGALSREGKVIPLGQEITDTTLDGRTATVSLPHSCNVMNTIWRQISRHLLRRAV
jgi:tetrahydromethanopterin S-methyltransferase subunit H